MNFFSKTSKVLLPLLFVFIAIFIFTLLFMQATAGDPGVFDLRARSNDGQIELTWRSTGARPGDVIELTVASAGQQHRISLSPRTTAYTYTDGSHGEKYTFSVALKDPQTVRGSECSAVALFLEYAELPQLPIVQVETVKQTELSCTVVSAPEDCFGISLTDNEYVAAGISLSTQTGDEKSLTGQIRIRGNTSALGEKKPYKLKLDQAADLLGLGNSYADREWLLLPFEYGFKTYSGSKVSELCGLAWQPRSTPVNVMINGDWKGCYLLIESVKVGQHRVDVSKDGFLIENDAYWWNEAGTYFKTEHQYKGLAYTFGYPDGQSVSDTVVTSVSEFMNAYESALLEQTGDYTQYIDLESFAGWLLAHDILGTWDACGSNMFLYKYDMSALEKLHIGPLWDFTSVFQQTDKWAGIHGPALHYDALLQSEAFLTVYQNQWDALSETLTQQIRKGLDDYIRQYGAVLEQSRELDVARYGADNNNKLPVAEAAEVVYHWFQTRTVWLNTQIPKLQPSQD